MRLISVFIVSLIIPAVAVWSSGCDDETDITGGGNAGGGSVGPGTGGGAGSAGSGGTAGTGGGGVEGDLYTTTYSDESDTCSFTPTYAEDVFVNLEGDTLTYAMTVDGIELQATGTWSGVGNSVTGTGDMACGGDDLCISCVSPCPPCASLVFDLTFTDALAEFDGTITLQYTLDADCGPSLCTANASVSGEKVE